MLSKVSEKKMHIIRYVLVIGWLVLISSLFYDPFTAYLTEPNNTLSPLRDNQLLETILVQGKPLNEQIYPVGARIFWGMVVPTAIMIILVFGHETWRRICPLYFLSQIPRKLGLKPLLDIHKNSWLTRNHFYLQFFLLFIGLNSRILFINSARFALGLFLVTTILAAMTMVFLYGGRSWCHYVCPFGMVQNVFTGPRSLLGSNVSQAPAQSITQSMCRTVNNLNGEEQSACIGCKSACLDINAEETYWTDMHKPGRKFAQYGYLGLVVSYFVYYRLYAGNFDYYFSGAWTHEENQLATLFSPGFYLFNEPVNIPKIVAVPLTLGLGVIVSNWICRKIEKYYRNYLKRRRAFIDAEQVTHRMFSLVTFIAFNSFFIYGGRPEILRMPMPLQFLFNAVVVLVSSIWLCRTWGRSSAQYQREKSTNSYRYELEKLPFNVNDFLKERTIDKLKTDELSLLAAVLPQLNQSERFQLYKSILNGAFVTKSFSPSQGLLFLESIRKEMFISDSEHGRTLLKIRQEEPVLFNSFNHYISSNNTTQVRIRRKK